MNYYDKHIKKSFILAIISLGSFLSGFAGALLTMPKDATTPFSQLLVALAVFPIFLNGFGTVFLIIGRKGKKNYKFYTALAINSLMMLWTFFVLGNAMYDILKLYYPQY